MNLHLRWLRPENFDLVTLYPYTSIVSIRILEQSHNHDDSEEHQFLEEFGAIIKARALEQGVKWDNKIAIELKPNDSFVRVEGVCSNLFIGFKDNRICIGLGVWQPDGLNPIKIENKK